MPFKAAIKRFFSRLGFKFRSSPSRADVAKSHNQWLTGKAQGVEYLRPLLLTSRAEEVASLQAQLEQRRKEVEQRDVQLQCLSQEMVNLKNQVNGQPTPADAVIFQDQLRDALEKNQQWLAYDQQREAHVESILEKNQQWVAHDQQREAYVQFILEKNQQWVAYDQQREAYVQSVLEKTHQQREASVQQREASVQQQEAYVQSVLEKTQQWVALDQQRAAYLQSVLEKNHQQREASVQQQEASVQQQEAYVQSVLEKTQQWVALDQQRAAYLQSVLEKNHQQQEASVHQREASVHQREASVRHREASVRQREAYIQSVLARTVELEEQLAQAKQPQPIPKENPKAGKFKKKIQPFAKKSEDQENDHQRMQHHFHKVQKELREAHERIAKLESAIEQNARFSKPSSYHRLDFQRLTIHSSPGPTSPSKLRLLMDVSFLDCPNCQASYPASRYRELLTHIDDCMA